MNIHSLSFVAGPPLRPAVVRLCPSRPPDPRIQFVLCLEPDQCVERKESVEAAAVDGLDG